MSDESVILVNLLKVKPGKQDELLALLRQNTDTVIRELGLARGLSGHERDGRRPPIEVVKTVK